MFTLARFRIQIHNPGPESTNLQPIIVRYLWEGKVVELELYLMHMARLDIPYIQLTNVSISL